MRRYTVLSSLVALTCWSHSGFAQETSQVTESEVGKGYLGREVVGFKPQAGAVFLQDSNDEVASRAAVGFTAELNLAPGSDTLYLGPSTGLFYSHLGAPGSNFFGSDAPEGRAGTNSNFLLIPANIKGGYLFPSGNVRLSLRAGGNIIYRSVTATTSLAGQDVSATGDSWKIYPNVGFDVEIGPVIFRPDWTITPENDIVTATAGVVIPIG